MIAALWLLAAGAALWFGVAHAGRDSSWRGTALKTFSTALLAVIALSAQAPMLIAAGLALGALGDLALSRPGRAMLLLGMAAFAAGHLAYVAAFAGYGLVPAPGVAAMAAIVLVLALLGSAERWLAPHAGDLRWQVWLYGLIIGTMAVCAVLLTPMPGRDAMRLGAALFVVSDVILALRLFRLREERQQLRASLLLWPLYWSGQALLLYGALLASGA